MSKIKSLNVKLSEDTSNPLPNVEENTIPPPKRRFSGKRLYFMLFAVAAIVIVAAALMIPQGIATIPLNVEYTVGEKMVYDTSMNATFQYDNSALPTGNAVLPNSTNIKMKQTIEVTNFDGEYYTLNHTMTMNVQNKPISISILEKMNKTGYSAYLFNLGGAQQQITNDGITSNSYFTQLLSKPEVKVGDSVEVPFPNISNSSIGITGDLTMTFKGVQDLTVPAGTYKVFRIDITSKNLQMNYHSPLSDLSNFTPFNITINMDMNYQVYIEYGTMRQIKANMQETVSMQSATLNYAMTMNMDMTLVEHIRPS